MEDKALVTIEQEQEETNIINLDKEKEKRLALGSKEPPSGIWLKDLSEGTIFFVRRKNQGQDFLLGYFMIKDKTEKAIILVEKSSPQDIAVDPIRFCNVYELFEILQDGEVTLAQARLNQKKEEETNE
jgi:hypothetical protein